MREHIDLSLSVPDIMARYGVSRAVAYQARNRGWISSTRKAGRPTTRTIQGLRLDPARALQIAQQTARHMCSSAPSVLTHGRIISDLQDEVAQAALIELWGSGISSEKLAYKAAKRAGYNAIRAWARKYHISLDQWVEESEHDTPDDYSEGTTTALDGET